MKSILKKRINCFEKNKKVMFCCKKVIFSKKIIIYYEPTDLSEDLHNSRINTWVYDYARIKRILDLFIIRHLNFISQK